MQDRTTTQGAALDAARTTITDRRSLIVGAGLLGAGVALGTGAPAAVAADPTLERGDRGKAVTRLQKRLNELRFWTGTPDGVFGHLTQQAVYAVQKNAGLGVDGVVGKNTWRKLNDGVLPTSHIGRGRAFEVDLDRQLLLCIHEGKVKYALNTSTGSGERYYSGGRWKTAVTPKGDFSMFRFHSAGWQTSPLGELYRPGYYDRGWAIHGSNSIPPYPASHGCSRISVAASDMLWARNWFRTGRRVYVH